MGNAVGNMGAQRVDGDDRRCGGNERGGGEDRGDGRTRPVDGAGAGASDWLSREATFPGGSTGALLFCCCCGDDFLLFRIGVVTTAAFGDCAIMDDAPAILPEFNKGLLGEASQPRTAPLFVFGLLVLLLLYAALLE